MKRIFLTVLLGLSINIAFAQLTPKSSSKEVSTAELIQKRESQKQEVIAKYLETKNRLVLSDSVGTRKAAAGLALALNKFKFKKLTLEDMNSATSTRTKIKNLADSMALTSSINKQRKYMMELSQEMWTIIDKLVPEKTVLYEQKCPMTGKTWLSDEKEIKNPYYPKNMLTCGAVNASVGE